MSTPWIIAFLALWAVVLVTLAVTIGLLRRTGPLLEQLERRLAADAQAEPAAWGAPVDTQVPEFRVAAENGDADTGREMTSAELIRIPTILLFMEEHCGPCQRVARRPAAVSALQRRELGGGATEIDGVPLRVVLDGESGRPNWLPTDIPVIYEHRREVSRAFKNRATPQAYLVDPSRLVVRRRVVGSLSDLREMLPTEIKRRG